MSSDIDARQDVVKVVSPHLSEGERLLWCGQPRQGLVLHLTDLVLVPFSILFCGIAVYLAVNSLVSDSPGLFRVLAIAFGLFGVYVMVGRFVADEIRRSRTFYGLTEERIIIISGFPKLRVRILPVRDLRYVELEMRRRDVGTISFGKLSHGKFWTDNFPWFDMEKRRPPRLRLIENVRHVHELILELSGRRPRRPVSSRPRENETNGK